MSVRTARRYTLRLPVKCSEGTTWSEVFRGHGLDLDCFVCACVHSFVQIHFGTVYGCFFLFFLGGGAEWSSRVDGLPRFAALLEPTGLVRRGVLSAKVKSLGSRSRSPHSAWPYRDIFLVLILSFFSLGWMCCALIKDMCIFFVKTSREAM